MPQKWDGRTAERIVQTLAEKLTANAHIVEFGETQIHENAG
jgi:hypothetical protein